MEKIEPDFRITYEQKIRRIKRDYDSYPVDFGPYDGEDEDIPAFGTPEYDEMAQEDIDAWASRISRDGSECHDINWWDKPIKGTMPSGRTWTLTFD